MGYTTSAPPILRSALLSPIYKRKCDASDPTNSRPVSLTSALSRLINTALTIELCRLYPHAEDNQCGFQPKSNTECAITYAVNKLRNNVPFAALLDLRKAYDCVPRKTLQDVFDKHLPNGLRTMFRQFLHQIRLKTKRYQSPKIILTLSRIPQGDPPSPQIFNVFMDTLIQRVNIHPSRGIASMFVDDVLLLAQARQEMQELVDSCH